MTEMIERVARSLCIADGHDPDGYFEFMTEADQNAGKRWTWYTSRARAAIEAMREPTKAQLEAAEDIVVGYDDFATGDGNIYLGIPGYPQKASEVWTALIDAALKETV